MFFLKKKKVWITFVVFLIVIIFALLPMVRGSYFLQNFEVDNLEEVGEYKSELNDYSVKVFLKKGPALHFEYSYVGTLFKGDKFIRNIFWVGPSGNDFTVEWEDTRTIKINNLTLSNPSITLNILNDKYDFRGMPFFN